MDEHERKKISEPCLLDQSTSKNPFEFEEPRTAPTPKPKAMEQLAEIADTEHHDEAHDEHKKHHLFDSFLKFLHLEHNNKSKQYGRLQTNSKQWSTSSSDDSSRPTSHIRPLVTTIEVSHSPFQSVRSSKNNDDLQLVKYELQTPHR